MKFYAKKKAANDQEGIWKVNGMFLLIFLVICALLLILGFLTIHNLELIFKDGLTISEYQKARSLLIILLFAYVFSSLNIVFDGIISSQEKFIFQKTLLLIKYLLNPIIVIPLLINGYGSVGIVSFSLFVEVLSLIINVYYCFNKLKVKFIFKDFDYKLLKETCLFTVFLFMFQIADRINNYIGNILLGRFSGSGQAAIYSIAVSIVIIFSIFGETIKNIYIPEVNMLVSKSKDKDLINKLYIKISRIEFIVMTWIFFGFVIFGKQFIIIWTNQDYSIAYYVCIMLMFVNYIWLIQSAGHEIMMAYNKHKKTAVICLLDSILNVVLSIILTKRFGIIGTAFGGFISLFLYIVIYLNIYYHKKVELNLKQLLLSLKGFVYPTIISLLSGLIILLIFKCDNYLNLVLSIFIYSGIYWFSMYKIGMNKEEKETLFKK